MQWFIKQEGLLQMRWHILIAGITYPSKKKTQKKEVAILNLYMANTATITISIQKRMTNYFIVHLEK